MSEKQAEVEIKLIDKQIELHQVKNDGIKIRGKWNKAVAEAWGMTGIKLSVTFLVGIIAGAALLRIILIFFNK